jgi:hypothetical protein
VENPLRALPTSPQDLSQPKRHLPNLRLHNKALPPFVTSLRKGHRMMLQALPMRSSLCLLPTEL